MPAFSEPRPNGTQITLDVSGYIATKSGSELTSVRSVPRPVRATRPRTPASIEKRLKNVESELADAAPLHRLQLVQERMDLQRELDRLDAADDLTALEREFAKVARGYAQRKGISYAAWRELGVAPDVLRKAGITRGT